MKNISWVITKKGKLLEGHIFLDEEEGMTTSAKDVPKLKTSLKYLTHLLYGDNIKIKTLVVK